MQGGGSDRLVLRAVEIVNGEIGGIGELDAGMRSAAQRQFVVIVDVGQVELGRPGLGVAEWCESPDQAA